VQHRELGLVELHLAVVVRAGQGLDVTDDVPALGGQVDEERRVAGPGVVGVVVRLGDEDRERGAAAPEMNHLRPLMTHSSPSL